MSEEVKAALSLVGTLVLMVAVFVGAFYASKWVAKKYQPGAPGTAKNIEVIERLVIGKDNHLMIVRAGGKIMLLGVSPGKITRLEEFAPEDINLEEIKTQPKVDFLSVLKDITNKKEK